MTAAQGMDVVERLPGCKGQAAGAVVSAKTLVKIEHAPVQTFEYVYQDTNGQNLGPVWKTQSFLLNETYMVIHLQDCHVKGNLRKFFWKTNGQSS